MRRLAIALICAASAAALALPTAAATAQEAPAGERPNIVYVMTDDQTVGTTSYQRNVSMLEREGTTFSRMYTTYPLCCPSRATYLTGQYSHNHRVIHNAGPFGGYQRLDHSSTLPLWLQAAGYRTMHVGRTLNGYGVQNLDMTEVPPGWTDWITAVGETVFNFERWQTNEYGQIHWRPGPDHPNEHQTDFFGRRAAELVDAAAPSEQPFFLSLTFPAPHIGFPQEADDPVGLVGTTNPAPRHQNVLADVPLPRPPNFDEADVTLKPQVVADRPRLSPEMVAAVQESYQQQLESLLTVDDAVGQVLQALRRSGELENTLIVYTSDNGYMYGEHRLPSEKMLPYDASSRVPMVMRGPGVPRGLKLRNLVGNIDWTPTILDAADAQPGLLMDGRSLFDVIEDPRREDGRELVIENGGGANGVSKYRALRNERYLWVDHKATGEYELYDLREDPYELNNLEDLDAYAAVRRLLQRRLARLQRCRGARACGASRPQLRLAARHMPPAGRRNRRAQRGRAAARCVRAGVRLAPRGREADLVSRVVYFRGRKRLRVRRREPFALDVAPRALPRGRRILLRARVETLDGRIATYDRRVRTCRR